MTIRTLNASVTGRIPTVLAMLLICTPIACASVRYTGSDPRGTLLLSDSLLFHGTFKLDS